jgi:hypothetical protein
MHDGTNFLDNPVINAIERNPLSLAAGGALGGMVIGSLIGFFVGHRRPKKSHLRSLNTRPSDACRDVTRREQSWQVIATRTVRQMTAENGA